MTIIALGRTTSRRGIVYQRIFNFMSADLLEFSETEKADVDVRALFS